MKNLLAFLLMLSPIAALAQLDTKYCGRYSDQDQLRMIDILPVEGEASSCFYIMYFNSADVGEDEVGDMFSGAGNCKKSNNRYTVKVDGSEKTMQLEFSEGSPMTVKVYDGKNLVASIEQTHNYDQLLEEYRLEEEMMNAEMDEVESDDDGYEDNYETEENYTSPSVYSNEQGWALSMLMYSATEGYFAAVSITEGGSCELNSLEGTIKPGNTEGLYIAETEGGCVFAEIRVKGDSVTLTEKKCKGLDRGSCPSLSGTYKAGDN